MSTIAAAVIGVVAYAYPRSADPPATAPITSAASGPMTGSSSALPPASASTAAAVGLCLVGARYVPCQQPHDGEVVGPADGCSPAQALSYAGGTPHVDLVGPWVTVSAEGVDGGQVCVLRSGLSLDRSVKDVLLTSSGDVLRRCLDATLARDIPCSQRHTAEFVYLAMTQTDSCDTRAEQYAQAPWSRLSADLVTRGASVDGLSGCLVQPRGRNELTASVRRLGTNAVPLA